MIIFLFFLSSVLQISISYLQFSQDTLVNIPFILGMALLFTKVKVNQIEYYAAGAGLIIDIFSASPFGIFALSLFTAFIFVRLFLQFTEKENFWVVAGVVFFGSILLSFLEVLLLFVFMPAFRESANVLFAGSGKFILREAAANLAIFILCVGAIRIFKKLFHGKYKFLSQI